MITVALPHDVLLHIASGTPCGGIVINPAPARRSRVAGVLRDAGTTAELACDVAFTNCRKNMAVTSSTGDIVHVGPTARAHVPLADEWLATTIARAETAFLLTVTPAGVGDVSYRNVRRDRHARLDALLQNDEPFPVQGTVPCDGGSAERLTALCLPRTPRPDRQRINSADPISVQHPQ